MRKVLIFIGCLFMVLALAAPARAAWSDAKKLSTTTNTGLMPSITTDANGYLHAVWMETYKNDGDSSNGDEDAIWTGVENPGIYYSKWNGDTWSAPFKISQNTGKFAALPSIASDSQNRLHVVWDEQVMSSTPDASWEEGQIMYSMYSGGSWSPPVTISTATNGSDRWNFSSRIAVDASDIVHVIYNYRGHGDYYSVNEYYYTKKNGTWSTAEKISESFDVQHASLAVGPGSTVNVALWANGIWVKRNTGSGWGTSAVRVSPTTDDAQYPKIIVDGAGKLHLVWAAILYDQPSDTWSQAARYTSSTDGTNWATPISLNTNNIEWSYWGLPLIGLTKDSRNNIYAGWGELNAVSGIDIKYRKWNGTSWDSPVVIRNVLEVDSPYLYQDVWDNQHFVWTEKNQGTGAWEIWYSIAAATWATIGSGGGSFSISTASRTFVDVTIPSGALSTNTNISAAIGPLPASANPSYVTIPRSYFFGPDGQSFSKAITTVYYYLDAEVLNGDPRNLGVYVWDGQIESWNYQTGTVNTAQKKVTIKPNHFSLFGVMSPRVNLVWNTPSDTVSGSLIPVAFNMTYATDGSAVPAVVRACTSEEDTGCLEDTQAGANVTLLLKDSEGTVVRRVYSDDGGDGGFTVSGGNYSVSLTGTGIFAGDYTLELLLGGVILGSRTFHFTPGVSYQVSFLSPLTSKEVYSMVDGSTLPVKFNLSENGNKILTEKNVTVKVDNLTTLFVLGQGTNNIRFDPGSGQYIFNLHTKDLGLPLGENIISVRVDGSEVGTAKFTLLEGGKATGKSR